mmetsp:Transcript_1253/g.2994  ORF Transcript_1253/g.2994 Transcript_1253/m.2994 type:complete len:262 (+) Transcript_1253:391-1176(+)
MTGRFHLIQLLSDVKHLGRVLLEMLCEEVHHVGLVVYAASARELVQKVDAEGCRRCAETRVVEKVAHRQHCLQHVCKGLRVRDLLGRREQHIHMEALVLGEFLKVLLEFQQFEALTEMWNSKNVIKVVFNVAKARMFSVVVFDHFALLGSRQILEDRRNSMGLENILIHFQESSADIGRVHAELTEHDANVVGTLDVQHAHDLRRSLLLLLSRFLTLSFLLRGTTSKHSLQLVCFQLHCSPVEFVPNSIALKLIGVYLRPV